MSGNDDHDDVQDRDEKALDGLVRQAFQRTPVPPVPADFAAQVTSALAHPPAADGKPVPTRRWQPPSSRALNIALVVGVAAGMVMVVGLWKSYDVGAPFTGEGELRAAARETLALDGRGVAVLEAEASVRWAGGDRQQRRWEQTAGDVFYRIDPGGGAFRLKTPGGEVVVLGTCFRVEVDPMRLNRQSTIGFAAGAGLAAAVVVTVYEGRVKLANGSGETELGAGERGTFAPGQKPRAVDGDTPAAAAARPARAVPALVTGSGGEELEALRQRVAEQEKELATLRQGPPSRPPRADNPAERFVDVPPEELLARATRCEVRYEIPDVLDVAPGQVATYLGRSANLTDTEREAINEAVKEMHGTVATDLRRLFVEMGGDPKVAEKLSANSLLNEMRQFTRSESRGGSNELRARLAKERAGLTPPPADLSRTAPAERVMRLMMNLGEDLERRVGERIGVDRARALRRLKDGWPGGRTSSSGC
jgi:hypothetical protein